MGIGKKDQEREITEKEEKQQGVQMKRVYERAE